MLDEDLAVLYGVETRVLVLQVKRNIKRFPDGFMFQLSAQEFSDLKSQFVISSGGHGGRRNRPLVEIMRVFVELRRIAASYSAIEERLEELERETGAKLGHHDEQLKQIFRVPEGER